MAVTVLNKLRTFNRGTLDVTPFTVQFSGFSNTPSGRLEPFAEATRVIAHDGVTNQDDVAARGDVRVMSPDPLTSAELTSINQILDSHDDTIDDAGQARRRSLQVDADALKVTFDAGIADLTMRRVVRLVLDNEKVDV